MDFVRKLVTTSTKKYPTKKERKIIRIKRLKELKYRLGLGIKNLKKKEY